MSVGEKCLWRSRHEGRLADNTILQQGRLNGDTGLLQKPYRRHDLARKVRAILDGPNRPN